MIRPVNIWTIIGLLLVVPFSMAQENQHTSYDPVVGFADDYIFWNEGLRFGVRDKISFGFGGRFVYDAFSKDIDRDLVDQDVENFDGQRAMRVNLTGKFKDIFRFKAEIDFADTKGFQDFEFKSNYLFFRDPIYKIFQFQIGYIREPFGLEELTSARFTTFMERALEAFNPGRNLGFIASIHYDRVLFSIGLFNDQSGDNPPSLSDDSETITARLCGLVYRNSKTDFWHLGAAYSYRRPRDNIVEFDARPDAKFGLDFIDIGDIENVDAVQLIGLESSWVKNNFSIQAEFMSAYVRHNENDHFWGAYVYCSYFVTGESRRYKSYSGKFGEIFPINPLGKSWDSFGAVELTARCSHISLDSGEFNETMSNVTLGLNWYLTTYLRITTNYIFSYINNSEPNHIMGVRFQIYW
ncbi:OprO/OprP family phosphate-selective porin [Candidatus Uabimicrobium amorphum]|uniref:Porin n=1 Tax=Uabimicrobium amorphum TaxID=2596890 RepID=A0A5S9F2Z8_UABAM|nr:porin [Candidatus Uabimicrobium amorphum]BBM84215.1 porin [Candidatus Uabimicrobium amorphum]